MNLIYVNTGTGNSLRVARWMKEIDQYTQVVLINHAKPNEDINIDVKRIGLITPTHGFTSPWAMLKFAIKLPRGDRRKAFCLATRAGMIIGKWQPPGVAGTTCFLLALILFFKGYQVRGIGSINMPSNWIQMHPGLRMINIKKIKESSKIKAENFYQRILHGHTTWTNSNNFYEMVCGLILLPVSFFYLIMGRFFLSKMFFTNSNCNNCGLCEEICPVGAISYRLDKKLFWNYKCETCMRCMGYCPQRAIEASQLFLLINIYIFPKFILNWFSSWLVKYFFSLILLFTGYKTFHFMGKKKLLNYFFTKSSLTHYWSRYYESDIGPSDYILK